MIYFFNPIFGRCSPIYRLILQGYRNNPHLNIIVHTDQSEKLKKCGIEEVPNVKLIPTTFENYISEITEKTGIRYARTPEVRKVCDLRLVYSHCFDYLMPDATLWGWLDYDILFGDTTKVLNEESLKRYEGFPFWGTYGRGMCNLVPNNEFTRNLWREFLPVLNDPINRSMSETLQHKDGSWAFAGRLQQEIRFSKQRWLVENKFEDNKPPVFYDNTRLWIDLSRSTEIVAICLDYLWKASLQMSFDTFAYNPNGWLLRPDRRYNWSNGVPSDASVLFHKF